MGAVECHLCPRNRGGAQGLLLRFPERFSFSHPAPGMPEATGGLAPAWEGPGRPSAARGGGAFLAVTRWRVRLSGLHSLDASSLRPERLGQKWERKTNWAPGAPAPVCEKVTLEAALASGPSPRPTALPPGTVGDCEHFPPKKPPVQLVDGWERSGHHRPPPSQGPGCEWERGIRCGQGRQTMC